MSTTPPLRVEYYTSDHVDNPGPGDESSGDVFDAVGEQLVEVLQKHGSMWSGLIGPIQEEEPSEIHYGLEDTHWNDELYHYLWVDPRHFTGEWLTDVVEVLRRNKGWGVCVKNVACGYIIIFADRLMVTGKMFEGCTTVEAVIAQAHRHLTPIPAS